MKIEKLQCLRGPNYWSAYRTHLIQIKLNLEQSDQLTTAFSDFEQRLENLMPSLRDHRCMHRQPGGFFKSLREGTNLAHVIEHVALELQSLAGMPCGFGRTYKTRQKGVYTVIFSYKVQSAGAFAAEAAIRVVEDLVKGLEPDIKKEINALEEINRTCGIGPSTQSILNAARRRKIPFRRLDDNSLVLLGQGVHQKIIQATTAATTSNIGVEIAADKDETKKILAENFIPTPAGKIVKNAAELQEALHFLGFPIVLKPLYGNHGRGITTSIFNFEEALKAFEIAQQISEEVIAERFIKGADFRFLVINFKVEAVARRTAAFVIGDGISTVHELIERTNENPNRGEGHEKILTKIKQDEQLT